MSSTDEVEVETTETTTAEPTEKRVTWAELFFDLVYVFAVTEISTLLHAHHGWAWLLRALIVFVPLYWSWVGTSILANTQDLTGAASRIGIFAVGLTGLFMALAVPEAYGDRGALFGCAYMAARIVLAVMMFRRVPWSINPIAVGLVVSGPLILAGGFVHGTAREAIWGAAALIDLSSPTLLRNRLRRMHFDPGHLAERFGLFLIIALGESVVAIGGPAAQIRHLSAGVLCAVAAAFVLACALWWVYFHFAADAMRYALTTAQVQTHIARHVMTYGHLMLIGSVISVAVGMQESVIRPGEHLPWGVSGLLFGGVALYLATYGYTRWAMFKLVSTTRLTAAAVVLALLPAAPHLPALAALILVAAVLVGLNVVEYIRVQRATRNAIGPR
ncbi:MAG TPA: low temperature requirement protein A [Jatrophihabitantaceae bacterium]